MILTDKPTHCLACGALPNFAGNVSILFICGSSFRLFTEGWDQTSQCKKMIDRAYHPQLGWTFWQSCGKCAKPFPTWQNIPDKFCQACAIQNALDAVAEEFEYSRKDWDPVRVADVIKQGAKNEPQRQ